MILRRGGRRISVEEKSQVKTKGVKGVHVDEYVLVLLRSSSALALDYSDSAL